MCKLQKCLIHGQKLWILVLCSHFLFVLHFRTPCMYIRIMQIHIRKIIQINSLYWMNNYRKSYAFFKINNNVYLCNSSRRVAFPSQQKWRWWYKEQRWGYQEHQWFSPLWRLEGWVSARTLQVWTLLADKINAVNCNNQLQRF